MTTTTTETTEEGAAGVEGNSRLTAVNGMVLLVLLAVEGVTVLSVRQMITLHVVLGIALVAPVLLKTATTAYRFTRYYLGAAPYRVKGPPHPILRVLGPVVIVSSLAVLGTGIGLLVVGPDHREPMLTLHQASFIIWFGAMTIHVLGHLLDAGRTTWQELRDPAVGREVRRRRVRLAATVVVLLVGFGAAVAVLPTAKPWTSHSGDSFRHHRDGGE